MLEGAFSFRGRIGRLDFFLASLLMVPAGVAGLAVLAAMVFFAGALHSMVALVPVALVGGLMLVVALWYSLSLHVRRIRDIGWDPVVVIVGWLVVGGLDAVVAMKVPALALDLGHHHAQGHYGTAFGAVFDTALSLALLFWPGRDPADIAGVFGDSPKPRPSRLASLGLGAPARVEPMPAAPPMRTVVRKEFGRRGVR